MAAAHGLGLVVDACDQRPAPHLVVVLIFCHHGQEVLPQSLFQFRPSTVR